MIPPKIKISSVAGSASGGKHGELPDTPGVYLMKNGRGEVLYVGKATSLKRRVNSYFQKAHDSRIEELVRKIREIEYIQKSTAIEALILEANLIKYYWPKYNVLQKDNKSFLYLAITKEDFPRPLLIRGKELDEIKTKQFKAVFGPYTSAKSLRAALDLLRKVFPWSDCIPGQKRPCFYVHLKQCPGVCVNAIPKKEYQKIIRDLIKFFEGKKDTLIKKYEREMAKASKEERYEDAAEWRNKVFNLEHIQDVAVLKKEDDDVDKIKMGEVRVNLFGRIEGYDISNISGTSTVASMVVFENGAPLKSQYRKFKIKSVKGSNDVAALRETLLRRFRHHEWKMPDLLLIDGGLPQVNAAEAALREIDIPLPVIGLAKGSARKRNDLVCSKQNLELCKICEQYKDILIAVRDEAHRFAVKYHEVVRGRTSGITKKKKK